MAWSPSRHQTHHLLLPRPTTTTDLQQCRGQACLPKVHRKRTRHREAQGWPGHTAHWEQTQVFNTARPVEPELSPMDSPCLLPSFLDSHQPDYTWWVSLSPLEGSYNTQEGSSWKSRGPIWVPIRTSCGRSLLQRVVLACVPQRACLSQ